MMTKQEVEAILGKTIAKNTYLFIERIAQGEHYEDIYQDLDQNREKYGIKLTTLLTKQSTVERYIKLCGLLDQEKEEDNNNYQKKTGVYGIYCDGELIYIGKTTESFKDRFKSHVRSMNNNETGKLYNYLRARKREEKQIELKPLIIVEDLNTELRISDRDVRMMELALIDLYKPICNLRGITMPYR